ncbi:FecR family protein [Pedobacter heparinus]|uniref:FecR family protein n=1 Tax=Pedobacter heparinus TaxID=984 RepID=UPI00292D6792|nr:FecR domain-containing protein [Pedobacter heparinus]
MDNLAGKTLLTKYFDGTATEKERLLAEEWYAKRSTLNLSDPEDLDYEGIKTEIWASMNIADQRKVVVLGLWPRIIGIAAAVAGIVFGIWFYTPHAIVNHNSEIVNQNDIAPGKNTATLTLANGKTINLSDAKTGVIIADDLRYNDNSVVISDPSLGSGQVAREDLLNNTNKRSLPYGRDAGKEQMLTITTPRGGTYQVILPDGTKVWLNAASSLNYMMSLKKQGTTRRIELTGEAYFEVKKDEARPFVVQTDKQEVTVLGTHFNVNSYTDEGSVKTTLLEGSVKVSRLLTKSGVNKDLGGKTLKPGQQAILTNKGFKVVATNLNEAIAWKDGYFRFYEVDLQTFMNTIARWYNIEVDYEGGIDQYKGLAFGGSVSRSKNISEVLKILAQTGKVHYRIGGRKVTITM